MVASIVEGAFIVAFTLYNSWFRFWSIVIFFTFNRIICSMDTSRVYCYEWPNSLLVRFGACYNYNTQWYLSWQESFTYIFFTEHWNSSSSNSESKWTFYLPQRNGPIIRHCIQMPFRNVPISNLIELSKSYLTERWTFLGGIWLKIRKLFWNLRRSVTIFTSDNMPLFYLKLFLFDFIEIWYKKIEKGLTENLTNGATKTLYRPHKWIISVNQYVASCF